MTSSVASPSSRLPPELTSTSCPATWTGSSSWTSTFGCSPPGWAWPTRSSTTGPRSQERYGLRPDQMLDYKALKGDTSDNLPGVPGVGEKTAVALLQQFGTLDAMYEHLDEVKGKLRERLDEHRGRGLHEPPGRPHRHRSAAPARPRGGAHRPVRPTRPGPALPGARVPLADRSTAAHDRQSAGGTGGRRRGRAPAVARSPRATDRCTPAAPGGAAAEPSAHRTDRRRPAQRGCDPEGRDRARRPADRGGRGGPARAGGVAGGPRRGRGPGRGGRAGDGPSAARCWASRWPATTGARGTCARTERRDPVAALVRAGRSPADRS